MQKEKKEFEQRYLAWIDKVTPRSHSLLNDNPSVKSELLSYKLLARDIPEDLQTTQGIYFHCSWLPTRTNS